jgi:hypothetical protein
VLVVDSVLKFGVAVGVGVLFELASASFFEAALTGTASAVARKKVKARQSEQLRKRPRLSGAVRLVEKDLFITITLLN